MPGSDPSEPKRSPAVPRSDPAVHVRPIGFVADRAIIRRIGDRGIFLGNVHAADPERCGRSFAHVLSLTEADRPATTHHHPLIDGPGNDWMAFASAVDAVRDLTRRDGDLLVHCTAGISRSATVIATALAAEGGTHFTDGFDRVLAARPHAVAHPALCELAVAYLAAVARTTSGERTGIDWTSGEYGSDTRR